MKSWSTGSFMPARPIWEGAAKGERFKSGGRIIPKPVISGHFRKSLKADISSAFSHSHSKKRTKQTRLE